MNGIIVLIKFQNASCDLLPIIFPKLAMHFDDPSRNKNKKVRLASENKN